MKKITLFAVIALILGVSISSCSKENEKKENNAKNPAVIIGERFLAYNIAKEEIKYRLSHPSTAQFPDSTERQSHIENLGNGRYRIHSYVEMKGDTGLIKKQWSADAHVTPLSVNTSKIAIW